MSAHRTSHGFLSGAVVCFIYEPVTTAAVDAATPMAPTTSPMTDRPLAVPDPWRCDAAEVVRVLVSDPVRGLSEAEVTRRLANDGPNELRAVPRRPLWRRLLSQFEDPLVYLLLAAQLRKLFGRGVRE
jgi:magnesium-transporting ATPase (P-type)